MGAEPVRAPETVFSLKGFCRGEDVRIDHPKEFAPYAEATDGDVDVIIP
jgi:hypothetical protein